MLTATGNGSRVPIWVTTGGSADVDRTGKFARALAEREFDRAYVVDPRTDDWADRRVADVSFRHVSASKLGRLVEKANAGADVRRRAGVESRDPFDGHDPFGGDDLFDPADDPAPRDGAGGGGDGGSAAAESDAADEDDGGSSRRGFLWKSLKYGAGGIGFLTVVSAFTGDDEGGADDEADGNAGGESGAGGGGTASSTSAGDSSLSAIKSRAERIPYNDLLRNIEEHTGATVVYKGKVTQVMEQNGEFYTRINVTRGEYGVWSNDVYGRWEGERLLVDDIVRFWGTVAGPYTYETVWGDQRTIPEIDFADVVVVAESGETSTRSTPEGETSAPGRETAAPPDETSTAGSDSATTAGT